MDTKISTTLIVMAAGMGSRFGGLKQIEPIGKNGEIIIDFSIYDAKAAGFDKAVFVIKKEIEDEFREVVGKRIEKMIDVEYAFQDINDIPAEFTVPSDRTKPWGTTQAVLCTRDVITTPFAVINADDYYGASAFKVMHDQLVSSSEICMVAFDLEKTLTENGSVSRGVCEIENGYLKSVVEHTAIMKDNDFKPGTVVSMNMWGFPLSIFDELEREFIKFLKVDLNTEKSECFLPTIVDNMIQSKGEKVKVLTTPDRWYGVTYKEDKEMVATAINKLMEDGLYDGI
ncbi:MAG: sugar phosphate nucleotidyltransferase [Oscillospiraceae bacterium]